MGGVEPSTSAPSPTESSPPKERSRGGHRIRIGAVAAVALAGAFVAWLLIAGDDETPSTVTTPLAGVATVPRETATSPEIATVARLREAAASSSVPFHWVGPRPRTRLELTRAPSGAIFIRYLPPAAQAGDLRAFLTVATYPRPNAFAEVTRASKADGAESTGLAGGGIAVYGEDESTNAHIAYPGQPYQIEVFAPTPGIARRLVASGAVAPL